MSGNGATTFNQGGQTVGTQANVGTNTGSLNVGAASTPADMAATIASLKREIADLAGLQPGAREQIEAALDAASGVSPSPEKAEVKAKLDQAGNTLAGAAAQLEGADNAAQKALGLAKTIFSIGKWVVGALAS